MFQLRGEWRGWGVFFRPFRPLDAEGLSKDVDGGAAFVPQNLWLGFDGTVGKADLLESRKINAKKFIFHFNLFFIFLLN
jgi:hypothetical protein